MTLPHWTRPHWTLLHWTLSHWIRPVGFVSSLAWKLSVEIYDIIMLVVLAGAMLFGAIKGFAWQLASIGSIVASYIVAYKYREPFSQSIQADPPWNRFLAMLILYIGTSLVIWVAFRMISGSIDRLKLREFDRQVGAMFGLAKGGLYCILVTLFSVTLMGDRAREGIVRSKSGHYIADILDRSEAVIPPEIHEVVQPYLERFDDRFNDSSDEGMLNQIPWLAQGQSNQAPSNLPNGASWNQGYGQPASNPPLPVDPRSWVPQQAQQPTWNGFQR